MNNLFKWLQKTSNFIIASMLAVLFFTFLLQIFSRYILRSPFGWTLELCLILWVWIVFFGCAFVVIPRASSTPQLNINLGNIAGHGPCLIGPGMVKHNFVRFVIYGDPFCSIPVMKARG